MLIRFQFSRNVAWIIFSVCSSICFFFKLFLENIHMFQKYESKTDYDLSINIQNCLDLKIIWLYWLCFFFCGDPQKYIRMHSFLFMYGKIVRKILKFSYSEKFFVQKSVKNLWFRRLCILTANIYICMVTILILWCFKFYKDFVYDDY